MNTADRTTLPPPDGTTPLHVLAGPGERATRPVRGRTLLRAAALVLGGALVGVVATHVSRPGPRAAALASPTRATHAPAGGFDAAQLERVGVRFAPAGYAATTTTVDVVGQLELDREHLAVVSVHAAGRIAAVRVALGQHVRRGEVLARIESPAIGEVAAHYEVKRAELQTARQHLARLRDLSAQGLSTGRDLELAEAQVSGAAAELAAASTRLAALGVGPESVDARTGHASLLAPIDGEVIRRDVLLGSWIQPEVEALAVADLGRLWAELDVFEGDLGSVARGDAVALDIGALGLRDVQGEVALVHAELDRATRMGRVRVVVANPDGRLRAGLSVVAHIRPRASATALVLPNESVRLRDGRPFALVRRGDAATWVPVEIGAHRGAGVEVTHGLVAGDAVAVAGLGLIAEVN